MFVVVIKLVDIIIMWGNMGKRNGMNVHVLMEMKNSITHFTLTGTWCWGWGSKEQSLCLHMANSSSDLDRNIMLRLKIDIIIMRGNMGKRTSSQEGTWEREMVWMFLFWWRSKTLFAFIWWNNMHKVCIHMVNKFTGSTVQYTSNHVRSCHFLWTAIIFLFGVNGKGRTQHDTLHYKKPKLTVPVWLKVITLDVLHYLYNGNIKKRQYLLIELSTWWCIYDWCTSG